MSNVCLVGQAKIFLIFQAIQEGNPPSIFSPHEVRAALYIAREQQAAVGSNDHTSRLQAFLSHLPLIRRFWRNDARIDWDEYLRWTLIVDELERLKGEWQL